MEPSQEDDSPHCYHEIHRQLNLCFVTSLASQNRRNGSVVCGSLSCRSGVKYTLSFLFLFFLRLSVPRAHHWCVVGFTLFDRVCDAKMRKTSLHHPASSPLLSASPDFFPPSNRRILLHLSLSFLPRCSVRAPALLLCPALPVLLSSLSAAPLIPSRRPSSSAPSQFHVCLLSSCPSCVCSHFLTIPRTRHFPPVDDPQRDPR